MPSSFSPNKAIEEPSSGSYVDSWATPVNANWTLIDTAFGGVTSISVTGVVGGSFIPLTLAQYQPPNIEFSGALNTTLIYGPPTGVGGFWSVFNNTTGTGGINFQCGGTGTLINIPQGQRAFIISDGANVALAQNPPSTYPFSSISGQIAPYQVPSGAVTQWETSLSIAFSQMTGTASVGQIPSLPASQIGSGVLAAARVPEPAALAGVTIQADPGTTPSGTYGQIFYYY